MSETQSDWRDRQGFTRAERVKEERARALRERFSLITRMYERGMKARRQSNGLWLPLIFGATLGGIAYVIWLG